MDMWSDKPRCGCSVTFLDVAIGFVQCVFPIVAHFICCSNLGNTNPQILFSMFEVTSDEVHCVRMGVLQTAYCLAQLIHGQLSISIGR